VTTVEQAVSAMTFHVDAFLQSLMNFVRDYRGLRGSSEYATQVRIVEKVRHHHGWGQIELVWDRLSYFTEGIADAMSQLSRGLSQLDIYDIPDYMDLVNSIAAAGRHVQDIHVNLNNMITQPDANTIYWINIASNHERISVHTAPLHVGPLIREHIWNRKYSTVLTSATLQTALSFDYIQDRLDAEDVDTLALGSPFDYESSTLLYLVTDIALPNDRGAYQNDVEQGLIGLCKATNGRALVLFTSYAQLRRTAKAISPELEAEGIVVYDQSSGTSRQQLIEGFRGTQNAVLLGTRSFWEGVDVPGQALSVLVIVRLPFSVPSDPIFEARSKTFDQPFQEYAVPEAILHFRQGFGRLIRRKTDRGVVVLFDRRVLAKSYGKYFLNSLPDCTRRYGPMSDLPRAAAEWIDGKR
jgi:DNA polymerase-3 subunit epsilon/ATP-dependent DNA helicase DinG